MTEHEVEQELIRQLLEAIRNKPQTTPEKQTMSKTITLKALKKGELFKRKLESKTVFIREHFNRKDSFGPASICCSDAEDINREVFLNPNTTVFLDFDY